MLAATPTKLRNGTWGARVQGAAAEGDSITIEARSGKSWEATVQRVLWSGPDRRTGRTVSLCATRSAPRRRPTYDDDHEDCLSVGPCGPHCDYAHIFRRQA